MNLNLKIALAMVITSLMIACSNEEQSMAKDTSANETMETAAVVETEEGTEAVQESEYCTDMGPQTPRDISSVLGTNPVTFPKAPAATEMNLCNIHTHTNAEHKGPGFSVFVGEDVNGGYACNGTAELTDAELSNPQGDKAAYKGVKPGQTIEVHWVHSSCDVAPGEGLGACLTEQCSDPLLRVETQVFLVVNDSSAANFADYAYGGKTGAFHSAKQLPSNSGEPVVFLGSTTGPSYDQSTCSPAHVTWSVRPQCMKLDINSLHRWAEQGNPFNETKSHGVRQLVTEPALLSPID